MSKKDIMIKLSKKAEELNLSESVEFHYKWKRWIIVSTLENDIVNELKTYCNNIQDMIGNPELKCFTR